MPPYAPTAGHWTDGRLAKGGDRGLSPSAILAGTLSEAMGSAARLRAGTRASVENPLACGGHLLHCDIRAPTGSRSTSPGWPGSSSSGQRVGPGHHLAPL